MTTSDCPKTPQCLWCGRKGSGMKQITRPAHLPQGPLKFECEDSAKCVASVQHQIKWGRP